MKWLAIFNLPCVFQWITGYYCPGCGGTRACRALLHGDLLQSLYYHPLVPYMALVLVLWIGSHVLYWMRKKGYVFEIKNWVIYLGIGITILNFIWKNAVLFFQGVALL